MPNNRKQPSMSTLMSMFYSADSIGAHSRDKFDSKWSDTAPLETKIQQIIEYAVNMHKDEYEYFLISPYGGEDIDVVSVEDQAEETAYEKGFNQEEIAALYKELIRGGYLDSRIKESNSRYLEAQDALRSVWQQYGVFVDFSNRVEDLINQFSLQNAIVDTETGKLQTLHSSAEKALHEDSLLRRVLRPGKHAEKIQAANSTLADCKARLTKLEKLKPLISDAENQLRKIRSSLAVDAPWVMGERITSEQEVEEVERIAKLKIQNCRDFYNKYGVSVPEIPEATPPKSLKFFDPQHLNAINNLAVKQQSITSVLQGMDIIITPEPAAKAAEKPVGKASVKKELCAIRTEKSTTPVPPMPNLTEKAR